jgi:hypothetical protein
MTEDTPEAHLVWCKARALELLDLGHVAQAVNSMISDLGKHEALRKAYPSVAIASTEMLIEHAEQSGAPQEAEVRRWIEGFKWPPAGAGDAGWEWDFADQLSEKIVDLVNAEMAARPDFSPIDLLAGQVLALRALLNTAEGLEHLQPSAFVRLRRAADYCLGSLWRTYPHGPPRGRRSDA